MDRMALCNCPRNNMYDSGRTGLCVDCPVHGMASPEKRALDALNLVRAKDFVEMHVPQTRTDFRPTLAQIVANAITDALARHDGNVSAAARELGINRRTIYYHQKGVAQRQVNPSMLGRSRS